MAQQPPLYQQPVYQQPVATPAMAVIGGNRNARNLPVGAEGREWSNGLCDCCGDCGTCFVAWCCPCIIYAQNKHRLEHLAEKGYPDPEHGGGCCTGDCIIHAAITGLLGLGCLLQLSTRGSLRSRYSIKGGGCTDCLASACCSPCALTQESREIELEEQSFTGAYKA